MFLTKKFCIDSYVNNFVYKTNPKIKIKFDTFFRYQYVTISIKMETSFILYYINKLTNFNGILIVYSSVYFLHASIQTDRFNYKSAIFLYYLYQLFIRNRVK